MVPILFLILLSAFALVTGGMAYLQGRSFVRWFLIAMLITPPLAVLVLRVINRSNAASASPVVDSNPYAVAVDRQVACAGASAASSAVRESSDARRSTPPALLTGLAVLALALLVPAVWLTTTSHASNATEATASLYTLPPEIEALPWEAPSSLPWPTAEPRAQEGRSISERNLLPTPTALPAHEEGIVTALANLRAGPGTDHAVTGLLDAGTPVQLVAMSDSGEWYQLASGDWIAAFLVTRVGAGQVTRTSTAPCPESASAGGNLAVVQVVEANLRDGPGLEHAIEGTATAGATLKLVGMDPSGEWYRLADGRWIYAELVCDAPPSLAIVGTATQ